MPTPNTLGQRVQEMEQLLGALTPGHEYTRNELNRFRGLLVSDVRNQLRGRRTEEIRQVSTALNQLRTFLTDPNRRVAADAEAIDAFVAEIRATEEEAQKREKELATPQAQARNMFESILSKVGDWAAKTGELISWIGRRVGRWGASGIRTILTPLEAAGILTMPAWLRPLVDRVIEGLNAQLHEHVPTGLSIEDDDAAQTRAPFASRPANFSNDAAYAQAIWTRFRRDNAGVTIATWDKLREAAQSLAREVVPNPPPGLFTLATTGRVNSEISETLPPANQTENITVTLNGTSTQVPNNAGMQNFPPNFSMTRNGVNFTFKPTVAGTFTIAIGGQSRQITVS